MKNFVTILGLEGLIEQSGYPLDATLNFEEFWDWLFHSAQHNNLRQELEEKIYSYFADIEIPTSPTPYDYLLLGLRPKDIIATFNWDPLLAQAFQRNRDSRQLPQIVFLHGNVAVGTCVADNVKGFMGQPCGRCGNPLQRTRLLYPIKQKDYNSDPFIRNEWRLLAKHLEYAYLLMIFGYSAPATDVGARAIMHQAWDANSTQDLAEIEVVDLRRRDDIAALWKDFIVRNHYSVSQSVAETWMFQHPRRTCEAFAAATLQNSPLANEHVPEFQTLADLQQWFSTLIAEEEAYERDGTPFTKVVPLNPGR